MTENVILGKPVYGVVLTDGQGISVTEITRGEDVFDCARRNLNCEHIEIVEPESLARRGYTLLIDEEGKLRNADLCVNCVASYLYGSQEHGDVIIGNAMLVRHDGDSLQMLTGEDAQQMSKEMSLLRAEAVAVIASALQIEPKSVPKREQPVAPLLQTPPEKNRQPCKTEPMER